MEALFKSNLHGFFNDDGREKNAKNLYVGGLT
jgi:hypothetical protein